MKPASHKRIVAGLSLAFLVLILVSFMMLVSADQENKNSASVVHTRDVLDKIDEMVSALRDAETGRRGYVISDDPRYGSHFTNQVEHAYTSLKQLRDLTRDNLLQAKACDRMLPLMARRLTISTNSVRALQAKGLDPGEQRAFLEQGQQAMELIRQLAEQMTSREEILLKERLEVQDKNIKGTEGLAALLGLCGVGLFSAFFVLFWRADARKRSAEEALHQTNQGLEQRVLERTAALAQSEARLRMIVDTALDAVISIDATGHIIGWNPQAEKIFGWTSSEVRNRKLSEVIIPAKHREAHERGLKHFASTGEGGVLNRRVELTALNRLGNEFPIELAITPIQSGAAASFCAFLRDISERKQAQEALAMERNLLRTVIDNLPVNIYLKDPSGRYVVNNLANVRAMNAGSEADTLGKTVFEFFPEETAKLYDNDDRQVLGTGQALINREIHARNPDGQPSWLLTTKVPLRDSQGAISGLIGISQDITQQKRAEQAVRESQRLLRAIVDNSPAVIYMKDLEGRYLLVNRRFCDLFHVTEENVLRQTDYDLFPREAAQAFREMDERVAAVGQPLTEEEVAPQDDGPHTYISVKCPLWDDSGQVTAVFGISTDITEHKRFEEMRTRLASIVESSDDAIFSKKLDGTILSWNPGAQALFGYSADEIVGRPIEILVPPELLNQETEILASIARGRSVRHLETERLKKDGTRIDVSLTISPIRDGKGTIVGASKIARDITERKAAENKLRMQLARLDLLSRTTRAIGERQDLASIFQVVLQSLEDNLPIDFACVFLYDPHAPRLSIAHIGGKSHALAQELAMAEHAHIDIDENGLLRCVHGELVYEPDITQVEFPFPQRLARAGLGSLVIAPLLVESQVFGVLVAARRQRNSFSSSDCEFLRQLSEHVALAAHQAELYGALQQAYDDLRKTQQTVAQQERLRALGQMASGIAHDINNALSPVAIYSEFILEREPNLSRSAREQLKTISSAIQDVSETVGRMREFYRQREPQLVLVPLQLNDLVTQVLDLTRARWSDMPQQRGDVIETRTELSADLPTVMGVESEIREALTNLILNAVDAMPNSGRLILRTQVSEGSISEYSLAVRSVIVEVVDNGIGMDEETQRRCMEPFYTTKGERGTGLGLAMVYGIARRHNADIEIESAPGEGTTVRLVFPVPQVQAQSQTVSQPGRGVVPGRLRILVVDDDPMLLKSLTDALEADGHQIVTANGGQAGIDAFATRSKSDEPFQVVFTDLGMPYIDGRRVASAVKGMSPMTPVILLTGWGQRLMAEGGVPENVDRVLSKPPKIIELRAALARCLQPPEVQS